MDEKAEIKAVKRYLRQARDLDMLIHTKRAEQERLRELAEGLSSPTMGDRVAASKGNTSMQTVDKIVDLQAEIDKEIAELVDMIAEVHCAIKELKSSKEQKVLTEYYINACEWEEIAEMMGYEKRQIYRIHGNALTHLKDVTQCHSMSLNVTNNL
ncbi:MAG: DUF1492 domain-containing protein [Ruminococcus sp.]|nr:DUF1492 domain-containing protein [Ruminococcus sp.]